jgi:hypothetical protein
MLNQKIVVTAVAIANLVALPAMADVYSTRNLGMGGAGVASSNYSAAPGSNGALLTRFDQGDGVAWTFPALGIEASDKENVIDTLDDIPDIYEELEFNIDNGNTSAAVEDAQQIIQRLEDVSGSVVHVNAGVFAGFSRPSKNLGIAFDVRTSIEAGAIAAYDPDDTAVLVEAIVRGDSSILENTKSSGFTIGAAVTESVLTLAHEFSIAEDHALSVSISPKYQRVDTLIYAVNAQDYDSGDFDDNTNDNNSFNVDMGMAYSIGDNWVLGLRARNLITQSYDTERVDLGNQSFQSTYQIKPAAVIGAAYNGEVFTATIEGDLLKNASFEDFSETQFVRAGVEYSAAKWIQLRAGYRYDIEENRENVITAGLALSPSNSFKLELAGSYGQEDTYGFALDISWLF